MDSPQTGGEGVIEFKIYHRLDGGERRGAAELIPNLPAVSDVHQDGVEGGQGVAQLRHHDGDLAAVMDGMQS